MPPTSRFSSRLRPHRAIVALALVAVLIASLVPAAAASAAARTPRAPRAFTSAIEDYTAYVPQNDCDPTVKHGTRLLGDFLAKTYPNTYWSSTRPCVKGSTSEHYDGRAIDWMVSVTDRREHAEAHAFWRWLLATDSHGNRFAMARRLGVMYIIYNNRMWGMWSGTWEDYNGCEAEKMQKPAYANDCHRTHMHISLSWNGARAKTTFWTGRVYRTDYGPCRPKHRPYAPKWTKPNYTGCGDSSY